MDGTQAGSLLYIRPIIIKYMNKAIIRVVDRDTTPNHPQVIKQVLSLYEDVNDLYNTYMSFRTTFPEYNVEVDGGEIQLTSQMTLNEQHMAHLELELLRNAYKPTNQ